jgi:hypothetical protein
MTDLKELEMTKRLEVLVVVVIIVVSSLLIKNVKCFVSVTDSS